MAYHTFVISIPHACVVIKATSQEEAIAEAKRRLSLDTGDDEDDFEITNSFELPDGIAVIVEYLNEDIREI